MILGLFMIVSAQVWNLLPFLLQLAGTNQAGVPLIGTTYMS